MFLFFRDKIQEYGVCVRVLGNVSLLPSDIQEIIAEVVTYSKDNTRFVLSDIICKLIQRSTPLKPQDR